VPFETLFEMLFKAFFKALFKALFKTIFKALFKALLACSEKSAKSEKVERSEVDFWLDDSFRRPFHRGSRWVRGAFRDACRGRCQPWR